LVEGELEKFGGLKLYQKVKPGITGWWACNGRSNIDYRERLELEYYYVKNCSLYLDILCIIRTIIAVLKKDGAQ
jgi:undecaprenyl-phosphate galactose phosphotransferase